MRLLPVLLILASTEATRRRLENDQVDINRRTKANNVDFYPERFGEAVDFGHVYRNRKENERSNIDLDMLQPQSVFHARELLRKMGSDIIKMKEPEEPLGFANPRDQILYYKRKNSENDNKTNAQNMKQRPSLTDTFHRLSQTIRKSAEEKIKKKSFDNQRNLKKNVSSDNVKSEKFVKDDDGNKEHFFSRSGFDLVSDKKYRLSNWTTCKEFAKGAVFHPDDVVNIQWVPFFIWSSRGFVTSVVHTLEYPTKKLVKKYKEELGPYLNININWDEPKLLLKASNEILLIAGDRKGLFYGIPHVELPSPRKNLKIIITVIIVRLKIVNPYLAMMYCNENYATIMTVAGNEPETDEEKRSEAAFLKFKGDGNPASRDLELESERNKFKIERKRKEEASKYIKVDRPTDTLHPSLW